VYAASHRQTADRTEARAPFYSLRVCDDAASIERDRANLIGSSSTTVGDGAKGAHRCGATDARRCPQRSACFWTAGTTTDCGIRAGTWGNRNSLREIAEDREFYELQQP
jgi:hypothetical protein